jgi:hypothetical protein
MESLAMLVAILFLIDIFAGPIAILLTWGKIVGVIESRPKALALALTVIRRLLHGFLVTIGFLIGGWLSYIAVTPAKLFGIFSLMTSYIGLRREYFPEFFLTRELLSMLGISRKNGRSSGNDRHGPEGQH